MKLTIFSRLTIAYSLIFLIMSGMNAYTILRLGDLNRETTRVLNSDKRILDLKKGLSDTILSQLGSDRKYAITKDQVYRKQSLLAIADFDRFLAEGASLSHTLPQKDALDRVKLNHEKYQSLTRDEVAWVDKKGPYLENPYEQDKGRIAAQMLEELRRLETVVRDDIYSLMDASRNAAGSVGSLAAIMSIVSLALVIGVSFTNTRRITVPLQVLAEKTKEISRGAFEGDLNISSPPEVSILAKAINSMCDKLKQVDTMKSDFFSAMSHELRTPLASIREGIGLLRERAAGPITGKQERLLTILSEETERLIGLVNSVLDLSKMEAGMVVYQLHREDLSALVNKVALEMGPIIESKRIALERSISENLPFLRLDRERILQVLRNVIGNAVKFTPEEGRITISTGSDDREVRFSVVDTGPGIPKENLEAIFEKFHQPPVKTSEWVKGTGLGLAIVQQIITAHGGKVWAESEPGQGSTFTFVLPL